MAVVLGELVMAWPVCPLYPPCTMPLRLYVPCVFAGLALAHGCVVCSQVRHFLLVAATASGCPHKSMWFTFDVGATMAW